jgi:hypothetical protein
MWVRWCMLTLNVFTTLFSNYYLYRAILYSLSFLQQTGWWNALSRALLEKFDSLSSLSKKLASPFWLVVEDLKTSHRLLFK